MDTFEIRPWTGQGDPAPTDILQAIGMTTSGWELLDSSLGELFDALVGGRNSNRAGFGAYRTLAGSDAKAQLIKGAARPALAGCSDAGLRGDIEHLLIVLIDARARRNNIAHGIVMNLGDLGFCLGPNNAMSSRWKGNGSATYTWVAADIEAYAKAIGNLRDDVIALTDRVKNALEAG